MTQSVRRVSDAAPALDRRRLLVSGLALLGGLGLPSLGLSTLTGCTPSDPRIDSAGPTPTTPASTTPAARTQETTPRSPSPTPTKATPTPSAAAAANAELALAEVASAILKGRHRGKLKATQRSLLAAIEAAHLQHATALGSPKPTLRPITPMPTVSTSLLPPGLAKLTLAQSVSLLIKHEQNHSLRWQRDAIEADGFDALLWGSMSVAATTYAQALGSKKAVPTAVTAKAQLPMAAVSDLEGMQSMVRQLHAIVYGYQLALGHLSESSADGKLALASLHARRLLLDRLTLALVARAADVPAAAPAYVASINPTTAGKSALLIRRMETALEPFCGLWLASATRASDRQLALDTLSATVATARRWKAPLTVWPGWQD